MSVRVLATPLARLGTVAVVACLRGGPRYEGPDEAGLTHLMEHVLFRGTRRFRDARSLMAAFEAIGEEPMAHTGDDELVVGVEVLPDAVVRASRLLAEVLLRPTWRDLDREKRVVQEERLEYVDAHDRPNDLDDVARRIVFPNHPLGRSLLGSAEDVKRYRRADLERHRRRIVVADNVVVAVAGPVGVAERRAVAAAFAGVPRGPAPPESPIVPFAGPVTAFVPARGSSRCELRLSFLAPGESDARWPALRVVESVLDGGPTARLPERLVDAGFLYDAHAGLVPFPDATVLEIDLAVSNERLGASLARTLEILGGLARGLERGDLERARGRILRRRAFGRDRVVEEAEWHARRALFGHSPDRAREENELARVRRRDVVAVAREVLRPERLACVLIGDPTRAQRRAAVAAVERWARASRSHGR